MTGTGTKTQHGDAARVRESRTFGNFATMSQGVHGRSAELAAIVTSQDGREDLQRLAARLRRFADGADPDALVELAEPYRDSPDVIAPLYERIVDASPTNARALVILANSYWLQGRGPEVVGELANRAIELDPLNRGAWHLWALSEANPRLRTHRWMQVAERFPSDDLALAALADNAAAVAGAERDYDMLDLSVSTYEKLLERSTEPVQRDAVQAALDALRGWRF